ncbi:MAG: DUF5683 domain-containing protein [Candidatus Zixiibacteriota bacterium]
MLKLSGYLIGFIILLAINLPAQEKLPDSDTLNIDSTSRLENNKFRTSPLYVDQIGDSTFKKASPTVALFKSMFIPGWGQMSNKKYIKAGIVVALEGLLVYNLVRFGDMTSDAEDKFKAAPDSLKAPLFNKFRDYENLRNLHGWYLGTVIFLSMFDAFVDAHLANFPHKNEGLSLELFPPNEKNIVVKLSYNF